MKLKLRREQITEKSTAKQAQVSSLDPDSIRAKYEYYVVTAKASRPAHDQIR